MPGGTFTVHAVSSPAPGASGGARPARSCGFSSWSFSSEAPAAIAAGLVTEAHVVGELGEVLAGAASGRREASEITIYKSLGVTTQDLAAGLVALREAERLGLGETLALDA